MLNPLAPNRGAAATVAVLGWLIAGVLGVWYLDRTSPGWFDVSVTHGLRALVGNPKPLGKWAVIPPTVPTRILSLLSNPVLVYAVLAALVWYAARRGRWELAGLAVLGPGLCVLLTELGKPLVGRRHAGYLSYPSGHMATTTAALTIAVLVLAGGWVGARWLIALGAWLLVLVCTAAGLVAMNYHYPSDTIGGFGLALGVVLPGAMLADTLSLRRDERRTRRRYATAPPVGTPPADISSDSRPPASPR